MKRKGIPKKRIGPEAWSWERSMRKRHIKVTELALNAAERSVYGYVSTSLCGINPVMIESFYGIKEEKKENNYLKEVMKKAIASLSGSQVVRVRGLTQNCASVGVKPCAINACSLKD
jgi:hypothetical protein